MRVLVMISQLIKGYLNKEMDSNSASKNKKEEYKRLKPPFGYFGSKNKIALKLCDNLPPHNCWVEAFCGSAALTLAKPATYIEIINDIDNEIVNFFEQLRNNHEELCNQIALTPYASQELLSARSKLDNNCDLERARIFLVQSMMAINGAFGFGKGGFSSSNSYTRNQKEARVNRWYNLPKRLEQVVERLRSVRIENRDARHLLKKFLKRPATLMYLDPPYLADRTNGYKVEANNQDFHTELLDLANKAKCMIFISGYENEIYNSILTYENGWTKRNIETNTKGVDGINKARTEVVWMNSHFTKALTNKRVPIRLSKKERQNKKYNPERK